MEEESGAKKPVTRLRRRLSVEQSEDVKSPSTPSTPTKRRGTRLATKPQLDLIDENVAVASPAKVLAKISKDITDTPEDRSVTPSRRSSRVKSNTSDIEEKTLTPSRRSNRINKSTSGTVVELTQPVTTSRALRASRRNSQVGSDTETSTTPGKKTRMGRRDSVSSIESQAESVNINKAVDAVDSDIQEKKENAQNSSTSESVTNDEEEKKTSDRKRKSPRLTVKSQRKAVQHKNDVSSNMNVDSEEAMDNNEPMSDPQNTSTLIPHVKLQSTDSELNNVQSVLSNSKDVQSFDNSNVKTGKDIEQNSQKNKNKLEDLDVPNLVNSTRHRTRSWTTISSSVNDGNFISDNENVKARNKRNQRSLDPSDFLSYKGSGDMANKNKSFRKFSETQQKVNVEDVTNSTTKKRKKHSESRFLSSNDNSINEATSALSFVEKSGESDKNSKSVGSHENKENILDSGQNQEISATEQLLAKSPKDMKSSVYIEDSDSNADAIMKVNEKLEDQCVPVVESCEIMSADEHKSVNKEFESSITLSEREKIFQKSLNNDSCEPMDIDETNITNMLVTVEKANLSNNSFANVDSMISEKGEKQEIIKFNLSETDNKYQENSDRLNFSSKTTSRVLEKSSNENKSTLILSVKDTSMSEMNMSKSPKLINNFLSKSTTAFDAHDKLEIIKRNNSLNELSATPSNQKKMTMQTSTPVISSKNNKVNEIDHRSIPRKETSSKRENISLQQEPEEQKPNEKNNLKAVTKLKTESKVVMKNKTLDSLGSVPEGDSSDESSSDGNSFFDDAAEEASDDYESGDSRDEDEKQYEKENEIIDKGETLSSEDEFSHDSDYEKDSFVVSSDAEDNELLTGSGDDLSMSDNELTMSQKSKKKYNARKLKEQKKSSKEMYESRHKLDDSNKEDDSVVVRSKKYNRQRLDSTLLESEANVVTKPKKNKRWRLDSTQETIAMKSTVDHSQNLEEKSNKGLSQSVCDNKTLNEKEISTVCDESIMNKIDPLSLNIKPEPKTPQMALDISTVNFTVREEIEKIQLDENVSIAKSNEFSDPLQSDDSSDSANEKFNDEYNSVLKKLSKQTKMKHFNISLNLDQEPKAKEINPIVNELNLTQTKKKKKLRNLTSEPESDSIEMNAIKELDNSGNIIMKKTELSLVSSKHLSQPECNTVKGIVSKSPKLKPVKKSASIANNADEESSDAIDFQLLFPEDSNDSDETKVKTDKKHGSSVDIAEDFIPLKKSEAKTDIRESIDLESSLNKEKAKRNKKRKLSETEGNPLEDKSVKEMEDERGRKSVPVNLVIYDVDMDSSINKSASKKNKNMKEKIPGEIQHQVDMNTSLNKSASKKKKGVKENDSEQGQNEVDINTSINKSAKKKDVKENNCEEEQNKVNMNASTNKSASKKNKDVKEKNSEEEQNEAYINFSNNKSADKKKKGVEEKQNEEDQNEADTNALINKSLNKKIDAKRKLYEEEQNYAATIDQINKSLGKKNKNINENNYEEELHAAAVNVSITKSADNKKKAVKEKDQNKADVNTSIIKSADKRTVVTENLNEEKEKNEADMIASVNKSADKRKKDATKKLYEVEQNEELITSLQENIPLASSSVVYEKGSKNKKRKRSENDENEDNSMKVMKENYFQKIHVPRLPSDIVNQLEDKSTKDLRRPETIAKSRKPEAIATTQFFVEETKKRKFKPSNYLEESIYLNVDHTSPEAKRQKRQFKRPKVLPFMPTVSTSASGFTTNFKVNIIPQETQFVAQKSNTNNFRNDYLYSKKIKRLGTYEMYKMQRTNKLSKF